MTVQDVLDTIMSYDNYIQNSMVNKSFDDYGCTYKWLARNKNTSAFRQEVFMATSGTGILEDRTVLEYVEIGEAK